MDWDLLGKIFLLWIGISTVHPTIVIHHVYDEPPEEEEGDRKVGFRNGHHREANDPKTVIGFRNKEGMMANIIKFKRLEEMILTLSDINKGANFMGVYIETYPIKKKSSPFFGQLVKRAYYNTQVNFNWENAVNNQRVKEGKDPDFISKKGTSVFERIGTSCLQKHKKTGEIYVRLRVKYAGPPSYFLNGRQVLDVEELDKITPDLPVVYPNTKQGLEKRIVFIRPNIKSIRAVTVNHETYICQA